MKKRKIMYTVFLIFLITITCIIMAQLSRQKFDIFIMN